MLRRPFMLRLGLLLCAAFVAATSPLGQAAPAQEQDERVAAPSAGTPAPKPSPALTDEAREAPELLRDVLKNEGRDAARELLRETVAALAEPGSGAEAAHAAYLLD